MDAQHGHVGTDNGLSNKGREDRGVVSDVTFAFWDIALTDNLGDTLNDVILALGVIPLGRRWVNWRGHEPGSPGECRSEAKK
jgi:hypothetical protein